MNIPGFLLQHTVTVEPYLGAGAYGAKYGAGVVVKCLEDDQRRLVRSPLGEEVTSKATIYCAPSVVIPIHSRVTLSDGQKYTVIDSNIRAGGGLPTPNHLEVNLN